MKSPTKIELTGKSWKEYVSEQPEKYPAYFKEPFTESAMAYFKNMLEVINERAIFHNSCSGCHYLIQAVQSDKAKELMNTWLDTYSPIRQIKTKNGSFQIDVIRDYIPRCSIIDGKANPYYSLRAKPRKLHSFGHPPSAEINSQTLEKDIFDTSRSATSELELSVKSAKNAFNKFIRERSTDSRKILLEKINLIPIGQIEKRGTPFLQGGAPGLGKKVS